MSEHQKNKEMLIQVAIELFSTKGFSGTSIRDIARAMNMSISNIYHYFGNKEGLLLAVMEFASTGLMDKLYKVVQTDMPPLERFKKLVRTHIESSDYYKKEVKIFFWMKNIFRKREMKSITGFNKRFCKYTAKNSAY